MTISSKDKEIRENLKKAIMLFMIGSYDQERPLEDEILSITAEVAEDILKQKRITVLDFHKTKRATR